MICWKIRIFAYWTTPSIYQGTEEHELWFAEKFVSLLIEQHQPVVATKVLSCCDLLKNSYLCLLNNTSTEERIPSAIVVICWKIRIFAYWTTPILFEENNYESCDLLKNSYLCLLNNTLSKLIHMQKTVVICWKIRIFAYWTTPDYVEVAQYESVVSNDRNGKNPMLEGRDLNKREVSSFLLINLHALSFSMKRRNWV